MAVVDTGQRPTYHTQTPRTETPQRPPDNRRAVRRSLGIALVILVVLVAVVSAITWAYAGNVRHRTASVPASGVRDARVTLNIGAGHLQVDGTAAPGKAVEASFAYNTRGITWDESRFAGSFNLTVSQKSGNIFNPFNTKNDWTIRLGQRVPVDLRVTNGVGEATLDLRRVNLRSLYMDRGAGAVSIDLRQSWKSSLNVTVHGGVGETTIYVPTSVGVLAHVQSGVGSIHVNGLTQQNGVYVNQSYGQSPVTLDISVDQGVGTVNLTTR